MNVRKFNQFVAYFPYVEKINGDLWDHFDLCVSDFLYIPANFVLFFHFLCDLFRIKENYPISFSRNLLFYLKLRIEANSGLISKAFSNHNNSLL
jgi:hypothetical protein